jgi:hypothetical protein
MIETTSKDPLILENEFYSKKFYFSYSGLNRLLYSPKLFYKHYVLQQREEKLDQHLVEGKVIHCLLLDNGNFEKQFIVSPTNLPTGNSKLVIDRIYYRVQEGPGLLENYKVEILEILTEINLHQKLKTDEQRLEKILTEECVSYFNFLKEKGNKDLVDQETLLRCQEAVSILRNDNKVSNLLCLECKEGDPERIIENEIPMQMELEGVPFGLRAIVDNIVIDKKNRILYINDLKTTGKTLGEFRETIEYYNYWMQAAVYMTLGVDNHIKDLEGEWEIRFSFIVIDKYQQVYCFEVSDATLQSWVAKLKKMLLIATYHYNERKYDLPYEFAQGSVIL